MSPTFPLGTGCLAILLAGGAPVQASQSDVEASGCTLRFRMLDDQADDAVRSMNLDIARMRRDLDVSRSYGPVPPDEASELATAEARRLELLRQHHTALNEVRRRCDLLKHPVEQEGSGAA